MKHAIYEDPITHRFALVRLPPGYFEGDKLPVVPDTRWFSTREEARAMLPDLLNQDE